MVDADLESIILKW